MTTFLILGLLFFSITTVFNFLNYRKKRNTKTLLSFLFMLGALVLAIVNFWIHISW